jgi:hypothetical protein
MVETIFETKLKPGESEMKQNQNGLDDEMNTELFLLTKW